MVEARAGAAVLFPGSFLFLVKVATQDRFLLLLKILVYFRVGNCMISEVKVDES